MTKHNMIQNDNILKRFLMYDLDNHCERLSKYILSLTIRKIQVITRIQNIDFFKQSTIASVSYLLRNILNENIKELDKQFLEKYMLEEINLFQQKLLIKIVNLQLKNEYELIFDKYVQNLLVLWNIYNQMIYRYLGIFFYIIEVNLINVFYPEEKINLKDKVLINIYVILFYIIQLKNNYNQELKKKNDSFLNKIHAETKNVFRNTLFINEMDNLKRHFDKINEYILKYISKTYDDDNVYPRISSNITKKEYVSYVILNIYNLFANYSLTVN